MKKEPETFAALCEALTTPKMTINGACRNCGVGQASFHRWHRDSRLRPDDFSFEWEGEIRPFHEQVKRAQRFAVANFLAGDELASRPLRQVRAATSLAPREDDPTADAPHAPEPKQPTRVHPSVLEMRRLAALSPEDRRAELAAVSKPEPSQRYRSMDERAEGIGHGEVKAGGILVS